MFWQPLVIRQKTMKNTLQAGLALLLVYTGCKHRITPIHSVQKKQSVS
jgi:galactokinase/mevalonate kinase-like predicted kinase